MPGARIARIGGALAAVGLLVAATACSDSSGSGPAAAGAGGESETPEANDAIAVRIGRLARDDVSSLYATSATLRPERQATVTARTRGVVRQLRVEEGDTVQADQPLASLEDDEQQIEAERARTAFDTTRREYRRVEQLFAQGLVSEEEHETARRSYDEARQADALARLNLSRTVIRAPFSGRILRRHVDVGATVSDGTAVYDLADLDPLYADVDIPERHVARLRAGQTVRLTGDASGETVTAAIERIAPSVDTSTGTVKVTLAVKRAARLRPGAFVRVEVVTDTHRDALLAPRSALVAEGRRWYLFRLDGAGDTVRQVEVRPGFEEGDRVEILEVLDGEAPLEAGHPVVVLGAGALSDGASVRAVEQPASAAGEPAASAGA